MAGGALLSGPVLCFAARVVWWRMRAEEGAGFIKKSLGAGRGSWRWAGAGAIGKRATRVPRAFSRIATGLGNRESVKSGGTCAMAGNGAAGSLLVFE